MKPTRPAAIALAAGLALGAAGCLYPERDYRLDHAVGEDQHGWISEHNAVTFRVDHSERLRRIYLDCGGNGTGGNALTGVCTSRGFESWMQREAGGTADLVVYRAFMQSTIDWGLPLWRGALGDAAIGPTGCFRLRWAPAVQPITYGACPA